MVVVGDRVGAFGAYRDGCEIIGRAASKHKELVVVEGYSHYDLYDKPEPVKQALDKLIPFTKHICNNLAGRFIISDILSFIDYTTIIKLLKKNSIKGKSIKK